jgi:hypothetical protein
LGSFDDRSLGFADLGGFEADFGAGFLADLGDRVIAVFNVAFELAVLVDPFGILVAGVALAEFCQD